MGIGQIVALMMVNKSIKFQEICFSTFKVIAKVKVCHNDNENDYAPAALTPEWWQYLDFFSWNIAELKMNH